MLRLFFRTFVMLVLLLSVAMNPTPARADFDQARAAFAKLSQEDKSSVVVGLIVSGDFAGLIDYGFTKRLYRAIVLFESREGFVADGVITDTEKSRIKEIISNFFDPLKLETIQHPLSGAQLPVPTAKFDISKKVEAGLAFERNDEALSLNLVAYTKAERSFEQLFDRFSSNSKQRAVTYSALRENYFVATGLFKGRHFYTMMVKVPYGTTGFTLTWNSQNEKFARTLSIFLANSMTIKGSKPSTTGQESDIFNGSSQDPSSAPVSTNSYGTGFFISNNGHLITNSHVVEDCKSVRIKIPRTSWASADLIVQRKDLDLALLKATVKNVPAIVKIRSSSSVRIGDDAIAFGFPLVDALSADGSLATGTISSLAGLRGDSTVFQISVPVQPGNSGGPLVDRSGHLIGVVVAKLNAIAVAKLTGDIPQNVNFAIKSDVLIRFLDWIGSSFSSAETGPSLTTSDIGAEVQQYSALVECTR